MPTEAPMKPLGIAAGRDWYWADPERFENPGAYYWNGYRNVNAADQVRAMRSILRGQLREVEVAGQTMWEAPGSGIGQFHSPDAAIDTVTHW